MQIKNKIKNIFSIFTNYWLLSFCFVMSIVFIIIAIFKLKFFLNNTTILYTQLTLVSSLILLWFKNLNAKNIFRKYITEFSKYIFLFLILLSVLFNFDILKLTLPENTKVIIIYILLLSGFINIYNKGEFQQIKEQKNNNKEEKELLYHSSKLNKIPGIKYVLKLIRKDGFIYFFSSIILIIIGFLLRLYNLGELGLWWDELITGTYVTRIMETGLPLFPSNLGFYWRGVSYHYFLSIFTFLFGNTEFWLRFPSVLFGMGTIILIFYYSKKINKIIALFILFFLVFSSYNIEYSRFARFYIMNVFLFTLSIPIFYKGFFQNKLKYKFLSSFIFFIMMQTVQTGSIFLSLVVTWGLFFLKDLFYQNRQKIKFIKDNLINFLFVFIYIIIFYIDNIFYRFIKITNTYKISQDLNLAVNPVSWNYFSIPKFELLKFFDKNYIGIEFIAISFLVILFLFITNKSDKIKEFTFTGASLFMAIIMYEIGSRGVYGPRLYIFAEGLIVMTTFISLYLLLRVCLKNIKLIYLTIGLMIVLFTINIRPRFYERLNINYGDSVISDPFRTTEVSSYRADYKTTALFIKNVLKKDDLLINVVNNNYFYILARPNYIFNQNLRWNTNSYVNENENFIDPETGSILINKISDIDKIISTNRRVYLLINGGSINILSTTHVREDFINFLQKNSNNEVFSSKDGYSKVLLFNK